VLRRAKPGPRTPGDRARVRALLQAALDQVSTKGTIMR
jgi:hypothetical protein